MDLLVEQLNDYSRNGIPRLPHLLTFQADEDTEEALYRRVTGVYFFIGFLIIYFNSINQLI